MPPAHADVRAGYPHAGQLLSGRYRLSELVARGADGPGVAGLRRTATRGPGNFRAEFLPYSYHERTGDLISVVRWSDFYTGPELRNNPYYCEYVVHPPVDKYAILVPLPALPGRIRRLGLWRFKP